MDTKKLSAKESSRLQQIIAETGSIPESVTGHADHVAFGAEVLDRVEEGAVTADDLGTIRGWLSAVETKAKDSPKSHGALGKQWAASTRELDALIAKMGD